MVMTSIVAVVSGLKTTSDMVNGLLGMKTEAKVESAVRKLSSQLSAVNREMMSAQADQATMIEEKRILEEEVTRLKAWNLEKERYQLISPWNGTVVYALKESMKVVEPPHWICVNCYEDSRKSIVTQQKIGSGFLEFICPRCKSSFDSVSRYPRGYSFEYVQD